MSEIVHVFYYIHLIEYATIQEVTEAVPMTMTASVNLRWTGSQS